MLFNSVDFALFFPLVFTLYWLIPNNKIALQNLLLTIASYIFYGWWDWKFLFLIFISTVADFTIGNKIVKTSSEKNKKLLLLSSLLINLGVLGFFKYFNFFIENFKQAYSFLGFDFTGPTLNIVIPVGISFYTFQTLSYTLDVYKEKLKPTNDFISFSAFVCFFPITTHFFDKDNKLYSFSNKSIEFLERIVSLCEEKILNYF